MPIKNIVEITDFSQAELKSLISQTIKFKKGPKKYRQALDGKRLGLLFDSNSLRTRISFETAIYLLGGDSYFVEIKDVTHEKDGTAREAYVDIIETMDRMVDAYVIRDYSQKVLEIIKRKNNPPFINGFCQTGHPSQALADLGVIKWKKKKLEGLNYVGVCDAKGSGVMESFVYGLLTLGQNITLITPNGKIKGKNKYFHQEVKRLTKKYKGQLIVTKEIDKTITKADVLYADEWWENKPDFLEKKIGKYRVDDKFLKTAKSSLSVMHCLPAHPDREITSKVMYGPYSIIFDQAEFRVYSAMSILIYLLKK